MSFLHKNCVNKQEYDLLLKRISWVKEANDKLRHKSQILDNINLIIEKDQLLLLECYQMDDNLYGIFVKHYYYPNQNGDISLFTFNTKNLNKICYSTFIIENNSMEITEIKTVQNECRKGHAAHHINILKRFAINLNCNTIYGDLKMDTLIGVNNLKNFYEKNGFEVTQTKFKLLL